MTNGETSVRHGCVRDILGTNILQFVLVQALLWSGSSSMIFERDYLNGLK